MMKKKEEPKREEYVYTPPEPSMPESLEERVEVLEGQVQPRTTGV